jgi:membrane protease YdiL (CAAX protease family)
LQISEQLLSALSQLGVVFVLCVLSYGVYRFRSRKRLSKQSLWKYVGLWRTRGQLDRRFWYIWSGLVVYGVVSLILKFQFSSRTREMLAGENSPYGAIAREGFGATAIALGLIYCFIKASGSEELLFRGLIAKRLYSALGSVWGNITQATIFWLMHVAIIRLLTGAWISWLQVDAFVSGFGLAIICGYVNFRKDGESIAPSWILHGSLNFTTLLTLLFLL